MRRSLAALVICACCTCVLAQAPLELDDPGLEVDANADGLPDAWGKYVSDGTATTAIDPEVKHAGEGSLRVEIDADSRCTITQRVPVPEIGEYTFDCWLKTDLPQGSVAHLYIQWRKGGGQTVGADRPSVNLSGRNDWTRVAAFGTRAEGADSALLVIVVQGQQPGTVWVDDATFRKGTHPTDLLRNPGFELGDDQPAGWGKALHGEGFTISRDDTESHSGEASVKLRGAENPGSRACYLQVSSPFSLSKAVRLSFWYKGSGRADGILRFRTAPGFEFEADTYATHDFNCPLPRDEWTEYVYEVGVPASALEAGVARLEVILYQKEEGTVWYDDVSIEGLDEWQPRLSPAQSALQMPNRPADGKVVLQNPPDFSWNPQPLKETYTFQLSQDPDFPEDGTFEAAGLIYNLHIHPETLADGDWHWRVRYLDAQGAASEWTPTRSFTITAKARPFLAPSAAEMLARIPDSHPRVYATADSLPDFRAPLADTRKEWWEAFQRAIDGFADRPVDPEPGPEYADYAAGGLTDEKVRLGNALRSYAGGVTSRVQQLGFGYLLSGEVKYADAAIAQMMEMATWDPNGVTSYRNHDQVFRDITWKMACGYDWCYDRMTDAQREAIREAILARASQLYRHFSESARPIYEYPYDSHGITAYGFLGVCAIALAHESEQADEWFRFIAATYPNVFPPWGDEEGGWCQGVGYWKWSSPFAWYFIDALQSATGVNMYQKAWQRNDGWYKIYMHPPWCDRHHFGDGNHGAPDSTDQSNLAHVAKVYSNEYFQWYAKNLPGWPAGGIYSYWWYDEDLPARPPADVPQGAFFPDIGWVAMHSDLSDPDDIMLMFKSSRFGSFNHSHADQNSFVLYAYGEPLLIDSGYYDWYGSTHDIGWTRQTRAHNNILVNGEGQTIFDITATGKITDHFTSPVADYTRGDATAAYKGKLESYTREIMYLRPDVFLIVDELEAPEPSEFTWCLHAENEMELRPEANEVIVTRGAAKCQVKFITPQGLRLEQSDQFTPPSVRDLKNEWHTYATTIEKSEKVRFVTLVRPYRAADEDDLANVHVLAPEGPHSVETGDLMAYVGHMVSLGAGPETRTVDDFDDTSFSARMLARIGQPNAWAIVDGTECISRLADEEITVLQASAPVTGAMTADEDGEITRADSWWQCSEDTRLSLGWHGPLQRILLDGRELSAAEYTLSGDGQTLTLTLPAGTHTIQINPAPQAAQTGPPVRVTLNDEAVDLTVETMPTWTGGSLTWGKINAPSGPVIPQLKAPGDARVYIGRQQVTPGEITWLTGGDELLVRMGQGRGAVNIALESLLAAAEPIDCPVVPDDIADRPDAIKFEAETFSAHGSAMVRAYSHREFLSGGQGVEMAVVPGHWVQWNLDVPRAGKYSLILKGAAHEAHADRLFELDRKPMLGQTRLFRFPNTGGFGATPGEWKHLSVCAQSGEPAALELAAGTHTLRMITADRKLNLDYLLLVPVGKDG